MARRKQAPIHTRIEEDRSNYHHAPEVVQDFRNYAKGRHELTLTNEQKEIVEGILKHEFADNVCHPVISEAADRIILLGFESEDAKVDEFLTDLFTTARLEDRTGEVHYDSLRDGNTVLVPAWNDNRERIDIYREPWWDGESGVFVGYDKLDNPEYGVKEWFEDRRKGIKRRVIWFEDHFERWRSTDNGNSWKEFNLPLEEGDDEETVLAKGWNIAWVKADLKTPLHIPYVHFPNSGRGSGNYGVSELDGGVLGYQDQLNALQFNISAAASMTAFQILWATGVDLTDPNDSTKKLTIRVKPGTLFDSPNHEAKFGAISAGSVEQLLKAYDAKLKRVAQMTRTPLHSITGGDWPSGEALLRAERPAVGKALRQIKKFKSCYQTLAHRAVEIANAFGRMNMNEDIKGATITALMAPPQKYDLGALADVVSKVKDVLSDEECLRKLEYTDAQIVKIMKEKSERDRRSAENAAISFSRGTAPGTRIRGMGADTNDAEDDVTE